MAYFSWPSTSSGSGTGDVTGPGAGNSTDNAIARYNGTGNTIQNSGVTIDDSNNVSGVVALTTTGIFTANAVGSTSVNLFRGRAVSLGASSVATGKYLEVDNDDNTAATNSYSALFLSVGGGTSTGDPYVNFNVSGVTDWTIGSDNSDSDKFKISNASALGTNDHFSITTGGLVTAGSLAVTNNATITGVALLSNGTAAAPSLAFTSDSDGTGTGIYRVAANSLGFSANGTDVGQFSSTGAWTLGNSGNTSAIHTFNGRSISTSSSTTNGKYLEIDNNDNTATNSYAAVFLSVGGTTSTGDPYINFNVTGGADWAIGADNSATNDPFQIRAGAALGASPVIQCETSGAVSFPGITTTASAANAFLDSGASNNLLRSTSSLRYKTNVRELEIDSSKIYDLKPISFEDKTRGTTHFGLGAEEVAAVLPELVHFAPEKALIPESSSEALIPDGVQYERLSILLLMELKKLKQIVETHQNS